MHVRESECQRGDRPEDVAKLVANYDRLSVAREAHLGWLLGELSEINMGYVGVG